MKKSVAIATVSLMAFAASSGVAKADYPPIEEVKPSTIIASISLKFYFNSACKRVTSSLVISFERSSKKL